MQFFDGKVMLMNTKHTDPYRAACDLNDQVSSLKQVVIRLVEIYTEVQQGSGTPPLGHQAVLDLARSMLAASPEDAQAGGVRNET